MKSTPLLLLMASLLILLSGGCADTDKTGSSKADSPSFADGVQQVISLRNSIRDGFQANDVDAAHGPLHEVGHALTALPELAAAAGVSEGDIASVKSSVDTLMDAFGNVDKTLHGGDGSTYDEEAQTIDAAITVLAQIAGVDSQNQPAADAQAPPATDSEPATPVDSPAPETEPAPAPAPAPAPVPAPAPES